jgi:hypothetical protein
MGAFPCFNDADSGGKFGRRQIELHKYPLADAGKSSTRPPL